uniref:LCI520 protein n=1 Tax=Chlorella sp. ArM0029B TaxID=1415603 RepID=A0A345AXC6_9CHLO|nr:LCI520 protein [Chlorella sp. ArM0029B]
MPCVLTTAARAQMQQRTAGAAPAKRASFAGRAISAHPAGCRCTAHRRSVAVRAESMEVGGRTIVVEEDGTIIISQPTPASKMVAVRDTVEVEYLTGRAAMVQKHFDSAIGADDFIQRVEMALYAFGFTGENSIGGRLACPCKRLGDRLPCWHGQQTLFSGRPRIARRMRHEGVTDESVKELSLVDVTKVAERTISDDLEYLISKTVDTSKADYAVITGVQVHNWANDFEDDSPNMEFVAPTSAYVVVDGVKTHIELAAMPPLTPRQINLLHGGDLTVVCNQGGQSTLRAEDPLHAYDSKDARRMQKKRLQSYIGLIKEEGLEGVAAVPATPLWAKKIAKDAGDRSNSTVIDQKYETDESTKQLQEELQSKYAMPK